MPTEYLLTDKGELRHAHPLPPTDPIRRFKFHDAAAPHTSDPAAHDTYNAYDTTNIVWSAHGTQVSPVEQTSRVRAAYLAHSRNLRGILDETPELPAKPPLVIEAAVRVGEAITPAPAPADGAINTIIASLAKLPARVDNLEASRNTQSDALRRLGLDVAGVRAQNRDVERAVSEIDTAVTSIAQTARSANEHARANDARIDALEAAAARSITIIMRDPAGNARTLTGTHHYAFPKMLALMAALEPNDRSLWLAGPAGAGKTTAGRELAEALGLEFYFNGAVDTEYKLSGFIDAQGRIVDTQFRKAWTNGGVYLWDECDASMPPALLAFNGALANGYAPFPSPDGAKAVKRHPQNYIMAAGNTWGLGGDNKYTRNVLDAAFLDRFLMLHWGYDEYLERIIAGGTPSLANMTNAFSNEPPIYATTKLPPSIVDEWITCVQTARAHAGGAGGDVVISPRASMKGAQLLRAGIHPYHVADALFSRYKKDGVWPHYLRAVESFAQQKLPGATATAHVSTNSNGTAADAGNWYTVRLLANGPDKIMVIKALRTALNLSLVDAKNMADRADNGISTVWLDAPADGATRLVAALRSLGADAEMTPRTTANGKLSVNFGGR